MMRVKDRSKPLLMTGHEDWRFEVVAILIENGGQLITDAGKWSIIFRWGSNGFYCVMLFVAERWLTLA